MFGYLKPKLKTLPKEQKESYRAVYCGLCHILKKKSGCVGLSSLNYELTALLILVLSLEDKPLKIFHGACSISPFLRVPYLDYFSLEFEIAADLSVYTVSCKIKDNIVDEGRTKWKIVSTIYKKKADSAAMRLNQCAESIENALAHYYSLEQSESAEFEELLDANGYLLQSLLYPLISNIEEKNKNSALEVAKLLGKWIYLIDACDDYQEDILNDRFNPITKLKNKAQISEIINELAFNIQTEIQSLRIYNNDFLVHHLFVEIVYETSNRIIQKYQEEEDRSGKCIYN